MGAGIANDMYNNDVGKGVVYAYEASEAKQRVAAFRAPIYFINLWLISYRHRYCTYLYYYLDTMVVEDINECDEPSYFGKALE